MVTDRDDDRRRRRRTSTATSDAAAAAAAVLKQPLTADVLRKAIDDVVVAAASAAASYDDDDDVVEDVPSDGGGGERGSNRRWTLDVRRATEDDAAAVEFRRSGLRASDTSSNASSTTRTASDGILHGIVVTAFVRDEEDDCDCDDCDCDGDDCDDARLDRYRRCYCRYRCYHRSLATFFYVAYSSWTGRNLYVSDRTEYCHGCCDCRRRRCEYDEYDEDDDGTQKKKKKKRGNKKADDNDDDEASVDDGGDDFIDDDDAVATTTVPSEETQQRREEETRKTTKTTTQRQRQQRKAVRLLLERKSRQALAGIALRVGCTRVTWRHFDDGDGDGEGGDDGDEQGGVGGFDAKLSSLSRRLRQQPPPERPERLDGVATLYWDADRIRDFFVTSSSSSRSTENEDDDDDDANENKKNALDSVLNRCKSNAGGDRSCSTYVEATIRNCLDAIMSENCGVRQPRNDDDDGESALFELKLADLSDSDDGDNNCRGGDLEEVGRLVRGLAEYVEEPDAVQVGIEQYRIDGGSSCSSNSGSSDTRPLFYCILLKQKKRIGDGGKDASGCDSRNPRYCGLAFCYLGCSLEDGPFWYLEDMFVEEEFRGMGAGTFVMSALGAVASALDCRRLVWQALVGTYI